jgi:hypothetical protein
MRLPSRLIRGSVRPDRHSLARFASMRWAALPIIDRRWTAPMSALALGFGLFVGVAIGPGTQGSLGTTKPMVIQLPPPETQTAAVPDRAFNGGDDKPEPPPATSGGGRGSPPTAQSPGFNTPPPASTPTFPPTTTTPPVTTTPPATTTTTDETTTTPEPTVEPTTFTGTVIHLNPEAASYTVADHGRLIAIHSHRPPNLGKVIEVEARELANGTYVEQGNRDESGTRGQTSFGGTVSFRDPATGVYTVSAPGVSLLVRGGLHRIPDVGDRVEVDARIADNPEELPVTEPGHAGCGRPPAVPKPPRVALEQTGLRFADGDRATTTEVEGLVEGVCRDSRKLLVSADDLRESGHDVALSVPEKIKIGALKPGQVLSLSAEIGSGAALGLTAVAGDRGRDGAEDADLVQP